MVENETIPPIKIKTKMARLDENDIPWTVDMEVSLFHAMRKHKPAGVNRHFQMAIIQNRLNDSVPKKISSKSIWKHLSTLYDLQALNESEIIPFPNAELEFVLPEEYRDMKERTFPRASKDGAAANTQDESRDTSARDTPRDGGASKGSKSSVSDRTLDRVTDSAKAEDSPKRKRTRQTPGGDNTTPTGSTSTKRARRT